MFEVENEQIVENPPTIAPDETSENIESASVTPADIQDNPQLTTVAAPQLVEVPSVVKTDDSAAKRIAELNKEAMNHRLKRDEYKKQLDEANAERETLRKALELRNAEIENNRTASKQELERIAAEKDAEIRARAQEAEASKLEALKIRIGVKYKLPEVLIARLNGSTAEELEADAIQLRSSFPQPSISNDSSTGINTAPPQISQKELMEQRRQSYTQI